MLAAREAVQESTGFSPNELQGPLAVLRDGCVDTEPPKDLIDYVNRFQHHLFVPGCMAREKLSESQVKNEKDL